jgi:nucleosome binding factor SPN SPT16 subunit
LTRDVLRIDAIPSTSLDGVKEWLGSMDIKFYESKVTPPADRRVCGAYTTL